ncbi:MAG: hypothetical protein HOP19_29175 [Acidobacteria bacterium]|nr:hypothetical protein [Acidobacteriota bacterium]
MPTPNSTERGKRRFDFKGVLFFFVLVIVVYLLAQATPIYLHRREMEDAARAVVQRAARQQLDLDDVKAQLLETARQSSLPADTRITLNREGRKVTALIAYDNSIGLPGKSWNWPVQLRIEDLGY